MINMIKVLPGGVYIKLILLIILLFSILFIYCSLKLSSEADNDQNKK